MSNNHRPPELAVVPPESAPSSMDAEYATIFAHPDAPSLRTTINQISPGPWTLGGFKVFSGVARPGFRPKQVCRLAENGNPQDLVFIQRARQDIPHLLNLLEAQVRENERLRAMCAEAGKRLAVATQGPLRRAFAWLKLWIKQVLNGSA